ncbi:MAG: hypothetical protein JO015_11760 [Verrucomicrobia bacterium]|nr:hypothetical protein [Verrucomicrobiota bacterium]
MSSETSFPEKISGIGHLREPFRTAFRSELGPGELIKALIYSPPFSTASFKAAASVMVVTADRWVIAWEENRQIWMEAADFSDTLFIELTIILLYGQLKVDFLKEGTPSSVTVYFNTVREKYYQEAVELLLGGIATESRGKSQAGEVKKNERVVSDWPIKFRNVALRYSPIARQLMSGLYWDALYGGGNRELSPASALVRTEKELLLIAEEKLPGRFHFRRDQKFGEIITYFPLAHLANYRILERRRVDTLTLLVHAGYGGETLEITFPTEKRGRMVELMRSIMLEWPLSAGDDAGA